MLSVSRTIDRITAYWFFTRWLTSRRSNRMRLAFLALRDVAGDLGGADDPAVMAADRRYGQRNGVTSSILARRIVSKVSTLSPARMRAMIPASSS
jgi:hypothetical protein